MKLTKCTKKFFAAIISAAMMLPVIAISPANMGHAAEIEPEVRVLGATLRTDGNETGTQSLRVGIEVSNASYAGACGVKVKIAGSLNDGIVVSTEDKKYQSVYSVDKEADKVQYTVVVANIPMEYSAREIEFTGFVKKLESSEIFAQTPMISRSVDGVVSSMGASLEEELELLKSGNYAGALVYKIAELNMSNNTFSDSMGADVLGKYSEAAFVAKGTKSYVAAAEPENVPYYSVMTDADGKGIGFDIKQGSAINAETEKYIYSFDVKAEAETQIVMLNWGETNPDNGDDGRKITCTGEWQNCQIRVANTTQGCHYISTVGAEKEYKLKNLKIYRIVDGLSGVAPDVNTPVTGWNNEKTEYTIKLDENSVVTSVNGSENAQAIKNSDGSYTISSAKGTDFEIGFSFPQRIWSNNNFREVKVKYRAASGFGGSQRVNKYGTASPSWENGEDNNHPNNITDGSGEVVLKANEERIGYQKYFSAMRWYGIPANATITIESITLSDKGEIITATPRPAPPAPQAPEGEGWTEVDLAKDVVLGNPAYISNYSSIIANGSDSIEVELDKSYDKTQSMQVCVAGIAYSNDVSFRVWSGGRNSSRTSGAETMTAGSSGVGFSKTVTLTQASSGADPVETFNKITICGPSFGQSIKDMEITAVYYKCLVQATPRPAPPAPQAPEGEGWTEVDLAKDVVLGPSAYISDYSSVIVNGSDCYAEFKLDKEYDKTQAMQVCVAGISYSNDVSFRTWSGGRWGTRTSDVQTLSAGNSGVGFSKTITLTQAVSGADAVDTYGKITLCPPSGQSIKDLEITSVYYKPVVIQERPELEDGEIDLSTIQGSSGCWDPVNYQVNINDTQEAYSWYNLRENVASGETVTVRMIGEWSGNNGFRVWIGNGHSTFCTEALSGQTYKKFDSSNLEKGEFDETFQFTATGGCDYLTVKCISGSCIDGLVIKRIIVTKD